MSNNNSITYQKYRLLNRVTETQWKRREIFFREVNIEQSQNVYVRNIDWWVERINARTKSIGSGNLFSDKSMYNMRKPLHFNVSAYECSQPTRQGQNMIPFQHLSREELALIIKVFFDWLPNQSQRTKSDQLFNCS